MSRASQQRQQQQQKNNPGRRDTVGLDSPRDSGLEKGGAKPKDDGNSHSSHETEFHVVSKRVVDACADLKVALHRRFDIQHVNDRFDEARNRTVLTSSPNFATPSNNDDNNVLRAAAVAGSRNQQRQASSGRLAKSATKFADAQSQAQDEHGAVNQNSIARRLARLQYARNVLITNASESVTKDIFQKVPEEWLRVGNSIGTLLVYFVALLVIPCAALQMDCSLITCAFNNVTLDANHTQARTTYLHAVAIGDCPFSQWSNALFGIWFLVAAAAAFGVVVFAWTVADIFFSPFHAHFKSIKTRTVVATLSSVPFRTRLFVVVPPLIGMGITGTMIYTRLRAQAENVTWSWGTIVAPAIVGYGLALLLKLWISWKYLNKQKAGGTSTTRNILPANWAKLLLILNSLAMTVAALVSPSVAAKMADCDADYAPHWDAVMTPILAFFGVKMLTGVAELIYRVVNGATSSASADDRYRFGGGGDGGGDDDDDNDDDSSISVNSDARRDVDADEEGSHAINFGSDNRPVWQDCIRLITRECFLTSGIILLMLKLHYGSEYDFIDWVHISIPFVASCGVGFLVGIFEVRATIRYANEQFCSLQDLMSRPGKGNKDGSLDESLAPYGTNDDEV